MEKYIKIMKLAERWDCSSRTIYRYIEEGYIKTIMLPSGSRRILFTSVIEKEIDK